jgi:hypothetical protein
MSLLSQITSGVQVAPRRICIYGRHGIGKTTFAAQSPKPIFLPTEDGSGALDVARFPLCTSFGQAMDFLYALADEKHDFQTIVVDSIDWLERLIHAKVCQEAKVESIQKIGYGGGYVAALQHWGKFLTTLDHLREVCKLHIILIGHYAIEKLSDPIAMATYERFTLDLHKTASALIQEWCDDVLFADWNIVTKDDDASGFGKKTTRAINTKERIIHLVGSPSYDAKNRIDCSEDYIPLAWKSYASLLPNLF